MIVLLTWLNLCEEGRLLTLSYPECQGYELSECCLTHLSAMIGNKC